MAYLTNSFDDEIIAFLKQGRVGFMPSDTIYGLSVRALDKAAVQKLHSLKDRSEHKPFIILISDLKMLDLLSINKEDALLAEPYWPGPLTLICPAPKAPTWLHKGLQTLAVRMPNNPQLIKLIDTVGPLISTSANVEAQEPATSVEQAQKIFGEQLDFYIDKGEINSPPSTIVKVNNGSLEVIRQGAAKLQ